MRNQHSPRLLEDFFLPIKVDFGFCGYCASVFVSSASLRAGHVSCMGEGRGVYRVFGGKT